MMRLHLDLFQFNRREDRGVICSQDLSEPTRRDTGKIKKKPTISNGFYASLDFLGKLAERGGFEPP